MNILIAPDSFKGSLTSLKAAKAISEAVYQVNSASYVIELPMADGGEGTVDAILASRGGERITCMAEDPLGRQIKADYGWIDEEKTAVVETAAASGLPLLSTTELNPERASSYGTGQLIKNALDKGAETIILGLGGSATVDAGAGLFQALGMQMFDQQGQMLSRIGGKLDLVADINTASLDHRLKKVKLLIASDVTNPLLGKKGAVAVFGPQKGVKESQLPVFEDRMKQFSNLIMKAVKQPAVDEKPGSGAAGGIGFLLHALVKAEFRSGLELMVELSKLEQHLETADLVITGEGKIDGQSLFGKVPVGIARLAKKQGVPVICFAGTLGDELDKIEKEGITTVVPILNQPMTVGEAMEKGEALLHEAAERVMKLVKIGIETGGKRNG